MFKLNPKDTTKSLYCNVKLYLFISSLPGERLLNPAYKFKLVMSSMELNPRYCKNVHTYY